MSLDKTKLTREELFELVWSKPMREIAPTLNFTDVGLAKICKRLNIPRPKQGHWLKDKQDRKRKPTLPPITKGMSSNVTIQTISIWKPDISNDKPLPVISTKTKIHPLVRDCRKCFTGVKPNKFGRLVTQREDVQVSRATILRAISLLNTIVHTILEMGYAARYSTKNKKIEFIIEDETMSVALFEIATRSAHLLTKKEEQIKTNHDSLWTPLWDYKPTGKLVLTLTGRNLYGVRTRWTDRKSHRLEEMLPIIIQGFLEAAIRMKSQRRDDEARERVWRKAERRRRQEDKVAILTDKRVAAVEEMVNGLNRAQKYVNVSARFLPARQIVNLLHPRNDYSDGLPC